MIWKLLRRNINAWQISGYALATLVGLAIVMAAVQFYGDIRGALDSSENGGVELVPEQNLVISKKVSTSASFTGEAPSFSPEDIAELKAQPWCGRVSQFQAADFSVYARVDIGDKSMSTALFFESIPDDLVDINKEDWTFDPENPMVPIVISKEYLTLYNFGFAASGRMPMVSENMMKSVPMTIIIVGNGRRESFKARIVGFSSWLNTIAVPQSFMNWAHENFGSGEMTSPSRLIVEVSDPSSPETSKYMEALGYEVAGPQNSLSRATFFLQLITTVVVAIGAIITILALFILVLSLYLLIQKNRKSISGLLMLGYTPAAVSRSYMLLVAAVNSAVVLLAFGAVYFARDYWSVAIASFGFEVGPLNMAVAVGVGVMFVINLVNFAVIRRLVRRSFR